MNTTYDLTSCLQTEKQMNRPYKSVITASLYLCHNIKRLSPLVISQ